MKIVATTSLPADRPTAGTLHARANLGIGFGVCCRRAKLIKMEENTLKSNALQKIQFHFSMSSLKLIFSQSIGIRMLSSHFVSSKRGLT